MNKQVSPSGYTRSDFEHGPFVVFYEVTRACDLVCQHCRACAQPLRDPEEMDTHAAKSSACSACGVSESTTHGTDRR